MMIRNTTSVIAVGCILVGSLLMTAPMFGFSTIVADRGTTVTTASDDTALVGLTTATDPTIERSATQTDIGTIQNNFDAEINDLSIDVRFGTTDLSWNDDTVPDRLNKSESFDIIAECTEESGGIQGTTEATIFVERAATDNVAVEGVTSSNITVDYDCRPGGGSNPGPVNLTASDVAIDETSQTVSFDGSELQNNDEVYINLSDPQTGGGVDYTDGTVTLVNGGGTADYLSESQQIVYDPASNEQTVEIRIDEIDVVGEVGDQYTISYSEQRNNQNDVSRDDGDTFRITE